MKIHKKKWNKKLSDREKVAVYVYVDKGQLDVKYKKFIDAMAKAGVNLLTAKKEKKAKKPKHLRYGWKK